MNGVMLVVRFLLGPVPALLLVTAGLPPAKAQTFDEAVEAYHHGDYGAAFRGFRVYAEQGNASAQANLGLMYDNGQGVPQDYAEAARWYRQAAEQGNASAQFNLGLMYEYGEGVLQNLGYAHKWFPDYVPSSSGRIGTAKKGRLGPQTTAEPARERHRTPDWTPDLRRKAPGFIQHELGT